MRMIVSQPPYNEYSPDQSVVLSAVSPSTTALLTMMSSSLSRSAVDPNLVSNQPDDAAELGSVSQPVRHLLLSIVTKPFQRNS